MLELLAYVVLLLVVMPALLLGTGKLVASSSARLARRGGAARRLARPAPQSYDTLHQRLVAAADANPLLPRPFSRAKRMGRKA